MWDFDQPGGSPTQLGGTEMDRPSGDNITAIENKLREFFIEELRWDVPRNEIGDDFPLMKRVDSLGLFDLVSFIEKEFGVQVRNEELAPEYFDTVGRIARLVQSKRGL
jgi:acyl carrier protein